MNAMKRTLLEMLMLVGAALVLGLGWNSLNGNGITISRQLVGTTRDANDDKPPRSMGNGGAVVRSQPEGNGNADGRGGNGDETPTVRGNGDTPVVTDDVGTEGADEEPREWEEDGIAYMNLAAAYEHWRERSAVFVDSRPDKDYAESHIQGALHLYHGNADRHIDDMQDQLLERGFVIVYCNGGDCEDSTNLASYVMSALDLEEAGIVFVFKGGMEVWIEKKLPLEKGE